MKSKIITTKLRWLIVVLVILGISIYFFSSYDSRVVVGPNIITVTEGTQGLKNNLRISVANIQNSSGVVYLSSQIDNTSKDVKTGDNFDFKNYHIRVIEIKENTRILPAGFTGGSDGSITLEITEK